MVVTSTEAELESMMVGRFFFFELGLLFSTASGRPNLVARCLARFCIEFIKGIVNVKSCTYDILDSKEVSYEVNVERIWVRTCFLSTMLAGRTRSTSAPRDLSALTFSSATSSGIMIAVILYHQ